MKEPKNYAPDGPSYQDQMYDGYKLLYNSEKPKDFDIIWDNCMMLCEHVHNERIRNKLSPITNLISIIEVFLNDTENRLAQRLVDNSALIKQCIDSSNRAVNEILDIPNQ